MRFSTTQYGRILDEVVGRRTPRKIFPPGMKGGRRAAVLVLGKRGRYVRYRIPVRGSVTDIAIMPTIRAAIMHSVHGKIEIKKSDLREKVRRRKVSILLVLVVDGSSSMLEGDRLATIRGIFDDVFIDAYQKRDRMAIVHCGGGEAKLLLSFAGNLEAGRQALEKAPWGGTDSLAEGLEMANEVIMQRLRIEKNAIPVAVILSDGLYTRPEFDKVSENLERLADRAGILCIDVGPEAEEGEETPLVGLSESMDMGYLRGGEELVAATMPELDELRSLLTGLTLIMVNPNCGPALMTGYSHSAIMLAAGMLEERLWEVDNVVGCPAGCSPPIEAGTDISRISSASDKELCPYCQTMHTAGALRTRTRRLPLEYRDKIDRTGLVGRVYLRRVVRPGALSAARNGLLILEPSEIDARVERALADAFVLGKVRPVGGEPMFRLPAGRRVALFTETMGSGIMGRTRRLCFRRSPDPRYAATTLKLRRDVSLSPGIAVRELRASFDHLLEPLRSAIELLPSVHATDDVLDLISLACGWLAPADPGLPVHTLETARAYAALAGREVVGPEDVGSALGILVKEVRTSDGLEPFINAVLLERLDPLVKAIVKDRVDVLFRNPPEGFMDDLRANLEDHVPTMEAIKGCDMHCAPNGERDEDHLCPECEIVVRAGRQETEQVEAPVVTMGPGDGPDRLLSRMYIKFKMVPGKLASAHRGVLVIKKADRLARGAARIIAHGLSQGSLPIADRKDTHPFIASAVAFIDGDDALPQELVSSFPLELDLRALIDGEVLSAAAIRRWRTEVAKEEEMGPAQRDEAMDEPHAPEHVLDLLVGLADAHFPKRVDAMLSLLRCARANARSEGRGLVRERDLGESAGFFTDVVEGEEAE
jgi:Mg-chelatase subunit ChlD